MKFNGRNVSISPNAKIGRNVRIGDNTAIYDGVEIGDDSVICNDCSLGEPLADYYENPHYHNPQTIVGSKAMIRSHTVIYAGSTIGTNLQTGHHACIRENTSIGDHCLVGTMCLLMGNLTVGSYCRLHSYIGIAQGWTLGSFVFIYPFVAITDDPWPPSNNTVGGRIDNFTQVAVHAVILPGIHIGENCLIGANALVSKDIPPFSFATGNPARILMDVRKYEAHGRSHLYPWMSRFDRGMPWAGVGFDAWARQKIVQEERENIRANSGIEPGVGATLDPRNGLCQQSHSDSL